MDPDREDKPVVHAYAIATIKGGGAYVERMSLKQLERIRQSSKATRADAPWNTHREEMQKKTVLRRLFKRLPVSIAPMWAEERDLDPISTGPVLAIDNDAPAPDATDDTPAPDALDQFAAEVADDDGVVDVEAEPIEGGVVEQGQVAAANGSAAFDRFLDGLTDAEAVELKPYLAALNVAAGRADRGRS